MSRIDYHIPVVSKHPSERFTGRESPVLGHWSARMRESVVLNLKQPRRAWFDPVSFELIFTVGISHSGSPHFYLSNRPSKIILIRKPSKYPVYYDSVSAPSSVHVRQVVRPPDEGFWPAEMINIVERIASTDYVVGVCSSITITVSITPIYHKIERWFLR